MTWNARLRWRAYSCALPGLLAARPCDLADLLEHRGDVTGGVFRAEVEALTNKTDADTVGHSPLMAARHYLQNRDAHFDMATGGRSAGRSRWRPKPTTKKAVRLGRKRRRSTPPRPFA